MPTLPTTASNLAIFLALRGCTVLGSAGYQMEAGTRVVVHFSSRGLVVDLGDSTSFDIPLLEVDSIDISGPGSVASGGGFVGGGIGVKRHQELTP